LNTVLNGTKAFIKFEVNLCNVILSLNVDLLLLVSSVFLYEDFR